MLFRSLAPVTNLIEIPHMFMVNPTVPVSSLKQLAEYAKTNRLAYASAGIASYPHLDAARKFDIEPNIVRLRGIGMSANKRSPAMPEIAAFAETIPGFETYSWQALVGPKGLPKEISERWNQEMTCTVSAFVM